MKKRLSTELFKELFQPITKSQVSKKYREIYDMYLFALYATKFLTNQSTICMMKNLPPEENKKIKGMYTKLLGWDFESFYDEQNYEDVEEEEEYRTPWD